MTKKEFLYQDTLKLARKILKEQFWTARWLHVEIEEQIDAPCLAVLDVVLGSEQRRLKGEGVGTFDALFMAMRNAFVDAYKVVDNIQLIKMAVQNMPVEQDSVTEAETELLVWFQSGSVSHQFAAYSRSLVRAYVDVLFQVFGFFMNVDAARRRLIVASSDSEFLGEGVQERKIWLEQLAKHVSS
ncbi:MAG: hypothetical protein AAGJ35_05650 [Myxococcota bacterium]